MALKLMSPAFENGGMIPEKYTCDGENVSPPLRWSNIPQGTESFAIIFEDPDAPSKTWVHWVLYNIPGDQQKLDELIPATEILANGAIHGINDFEKRAYRGPCPPRSAHRYILKLYALDTEVDLPPGANKKELLTVMKDHIIGEAELMGKYERPT